MKRHHFLGLILVAMSIGQMRGVTTTAIEMILGMVFLLGVFKIKVHNARKPILPRWMRAVRGVN